MKRRSIGNTVIRSTAAWSERRYLILFAAMYRQKKKFTAKKMAKASSSVLIHVGSLGR